MYMLHNNIDRKDSLLTAQNTTVEENGLISSAGDNFENTKLSLLHASSESSKTNAGSKTRSKKRKVARDQIAKVVPVRTSKRKRKIVSREQPGEREVEIARARARAAAAAKAAATKAAKAAAKAALASKTTAAGRACFAKTVPKVGADLSPFSSKAPAAKRQRVSGNKRHQKGSLYRSAKKPKRPKTAYNYFQLAIREELWEELNPVIDGPKDRVTHNEKVARVIGKRWKALTKQERVVYQAMADRDKKRYAQEHSAYVDALRTCYQSSQLKPKPQQPSKSMKNVRNIEGRKTRGGRSRERRSTIGMNEAKQKTGESSDVEEHEEELEEIEREVVEMRGRDDEDVDVEKEIQEIIEEPRSGDDAATAGDTSDNTSDNSIPSSNYSSLGSPEDENSISLHNRFHHHNDDKATFPSPRLEPSLLFSSYRLSPCISMIKSEHAEMEMEMISDVTEVLQEFTDWTSVTQ
eukprot:jgi/Bigna1/89741/estExt_fgenesh1_pg.C_540127